MSLPMFLPRIFLQRENPLDWFTKVLIPKTSQTAFPEALVPVETYTCRILVDWCRSKLCSKKFWMPYFTVLFSDPVTSITSLF